MPGDFLEDDLSVFTNPNDFGDTATFTKLAGQVVSEEVDGQFYDLNLVINPFSGEYDINTDAIFVCAKSDVTGVIQNDLLTIRSISWEVKIVPSSTSNLMIILGINRV